MEFSLHCILFPIEVETYQPLSDVSTNILIKILKKGFNISEEIYENILQRVNHFGPGFEVIFLFFFLTNFLVPFN